MSVHCTVDTSTLHPIPCSYYVPIWSGVVSGYSFVHGTVEWVGFLGRVTVKNN